MEFNEQKNRPMAESYQAGEGSALPIPAVQGGGPQLPAQESFNQRLKLLFGDDFELGSEKGYAMLTDYLKSNMEQNNRLVEVLEKDPRLAQLLVDVIDGRRSALAALSRYFGRDLLMVDENSPEYEELLDAEVDRRQEAMEMAESRRRYEENLEQSLPVITEYCKQRGYDRGEFMDRVWQKIVSPVLAGSYSPQVCAALDNALNYEADVRDAFEAGNVKGRNTSIRQMHGGLGDGMPAGLSGGVAGEPAPRRRNSLIEAALKA